MSEVPERVAELSERARREKAAFEPPANPPDEQAALEYLTEGAGQVVACYIDARTGESFRFDEAEFALLERALNDWLELYAACYGTELEGTYTVREAAELLVDTHSIRQTAVLLTHVPERDGAGAWPRR